jgi:hypothetical protein
MRRVFVFKSRCHTPPSVTRATCIQAHHVDKTVGVIYSEPLFTLHPRWFRQTQVSTNAPLTCLTGIHRPFKSVGSFSKTLAAKFKDFLHSSGCIKEEECALVEQRNARLTYSSFNTLFSISTGLFPYLLARKAPPFPFL